MRLGHYELFELLAHDGLDSVYRARDTRLDRGVAVRVMLSGTPEAREYLVRGAKAIASLKPYPRIVPILHVDQQGETLFVVTEFAEGDPLDQIWEPRLKTERLLQVVGDVARALDYTHLHGVVHRRVTPSNIIVKENGAKLTGYSMSDRVDEAVSKKALTMFVAAYMAPEIAEGEGCTPKSDQYSLAVIAYKAMTGSFPWVSYLDLLDRSKLPRPEEFNSEIPTGVGDVLLKGLSLRPEDRFASCTEFANALAKAYPMTSGRLVGQVALGRYSLLDVLGEGGMGTVYRAHDQFSGNFVAVKTIRPATLSEDPQAAEEFLSRLMIEARASLMLNHPNIVEVQQFGLDGNLACIVMEYLSGQSLDKILRSGLKVSQLMPILRTTAQALDYAHSKGIIHRDVSPDNILVLPDGKAKLADFGIAKIAGFKAITETGATVGKWSYMAPERLKADNAVTGAADQYSLAAVAYRGITGRMPLESKDVYSMSYKIIFEEPPDPGPPFGPTLLRGLAKQPNARFSSCLEFVDALSDSITLN